MQLGPWRYQPAPGVDIAVDDYRVNPRLWQRTRGAAFADLDGEPMAILSASGRFIFLGRLVPRSPGTAYTRFSLEIRTEALRPRASDRRGVVIRATSFDADRRRIRYWPHEILEGAPPDMAWRRLSIVVPWEDPVAMMRLDVASLAASGTISVRRVSIEPLVDAPWYWPARIALTGLWTALAACAAVAVLRRLHPRPFAAAVAVTAMGLLVAAILPQPVFDRLASPFEGPLAATVRATSQLVPPRSPPAEAGRPSPAPAPSTPAAPAAGDADGAETTEAVALSPPPARDPGPAGGLTAGDALEIARDGAGWLRRQIEGNSLHAAGFAILAFLVVGFGRLPPLRVALAIAGIAMATEALQLLTITRDPAVNDLVVDASGGLFGILAGYGLRGFLAYRRSSAPPGPHPAG